MQFVEYNISNGEAGGMSGDVLGGVELLSFNQSVRQTGVDVSASQTDSDAKPPASGSVGNSGQDVFFVVVEKVLIPFICSVGLIGNTLCIVVLSRQRMRRGVDGPEKVVHVGLLSMAVTDLLFCLCALPRSFISEQNLFLVQGSFELFYQLYGMGMMTTFILLSTWLIVATAGIRYIGICHPLKARYLVSPRGLYTVLTTSTVACVLINLPSFWTFKSLPLHIMNEDGNEMVTIDLGMFSHDKVQGVVFLWGRATLGVFIPWLLMTYFNIRLIMALNASRKLRKSHVLQSPRASTTGLNMLPVNGNAHARPAASSHSHDSGHNRLTRTLVAVVAMFVLLVYPSEILDFIHVLTPGSIKEKQMFIIMRVVTNILQVLNFACNFVVYCILSAAFRKSLINIFEPCRRLLVCCRHETRRPDEEGTFASSSTLPREKHNIILNQRDNKAYKNYVMMNCADTQTTCASTFV